MNDDLAEFLRRAAARRSTRAPGIEILDSSQESRADANREEVAEHVTRHLDTSDVSERASHLGERVGLADEKLESHLHETFDHHLGRLGVQAADAGPKADTPVLEETAAAVVQMLRDPQTLRQAIVLQEVLQPAFKRL